MSNTNVAYGSVYCIHDTRPLPPHTLHTRPPPHAPVLPVKLRTSRRARRVMAAGTVPVSVLLWWVGRSWLVVSR